MNNVFKNYCTILLYYKRDKLVHCNRYDLAALQASTCHGSARLTMTGNTIKLCE